MRVMGADENRNSTSGSRAAAARADIFADRADRADREGAAAHVGRGGMLSLLVHAAAIGLVWLIVPRLPAREAAPESAPANTPAGIVWLVSEGPGGGGGGGGNRSPAPPHRLQTRGPQSLSLSVAAPPPLVPPRVMPPQAPPPPPPIALRLPAQRMDAGQMAALGAVDGSLDAPPTSRGSGQGSGAGNDGRGAGSGPGDGDGLDRGQQQGTGGDVYRVGGLVMAPQVLQEVKPRYTADAMRARIEGDVWVSAVVLPDGRVGDLKVMRSLDATFGLDEEALRAVRQWRFKPGMRAGQPVAVLVSVSVGFTMR